jgi:hypothetical protein
MVSLFMHDPFTGLYTEIGRSDIISNDTLPQFTKSILINKFKVEGKKFSRERNKLVSYNNLRFVVKTIL